MMIVFLSVICAISVLGDETLVARRDEATIKIEWTKIVISIPLQSNEENVPISLPPSATTIAPGTSYPTLEPAETSTSDTTTGINIETTTFWSEETTDESSGLSETSVTIGEQESVVTTQTSYSEATTTTTNASSTTGEEGKGADTIPPSDCPKKIKEGELFNDTYFQYRCVNMKPDFVGCLAENPKVVLINQTGLYRSEEKVDYIVHCTVLEGPVGMLHVQPKIVAQPKVSEGTNMEGCHLKDTFIAGNETFNQGDMRHFCRPVKGGKFELDSYSIHDCVYKSRHYAANKEHEFPETQKKNVMKSVYFCNSDVKGKAEFEFRHCLVGEVKLQDGEKRSVEGKEVKCTKKSLGATDKTKKSD